MNLQDTIVSSATSGGVSSLSVVRLSGSLSLSLAKKITKQDNIKPRIVKLHYFYDKDGNLIDQGIILYFQAPKSFTGEDIIEFQCHGGLIISEEIIETLIFYGARISKAGEFSKRAFLNGKIDLSKLEAISKLISSKSKYSNQLLLKHLKGDLKKFIDEGREALIKILAYSEVIIDYAEEDFPKDILNNIFNQLNNLISHIDKIILSSQRRKGLIDGFKVVIIGKPNVGKSSLLNSLLNYDRAIVSDIAGTTRDTIEENIRIGSHIIKFIDTAGIRKSQNEIENIGIDKSIKAIENSNVVIALFDKSSIFSKEDENIINILNNLPKDKHNIILLSKSDKKLSFNINKLNKFTYFEISIKDSFNSLIKYLENYFNSISENNEEIILISNRQIKAVSDTKKHLISSKELLQKNKLELFSYHIEDAIKSLSSISAPYNNEEVLDKIFSEFCLGK